MESNPQEGFNRLSELYDRWKCVANRLAKSRIEDLVVQIVNNKYYVPYDIYIEACGGNASGLCSHGFFESDLLNVISILKSHCKKIR